MTRNNHIGQGREAPAADAKSSGRSRLKPAEYLRQAKLNLRGGKHKEAFSLLQQATVHYPHEPVLLSYYGSLLSVVDRKYRMGIETCQRAIEKLQIQGSFDEGTFYPVFYHNLGKAYAASGKRKEALDALNKGLSYDRVNNDILKELQSMGMRTRKPPLPFLDRANPLNKYLAIMLYKRKGGVHQKRQAAAR